MPPMRSSTWSHDSGRRRVHCPMTEANPDGFAPVARLLERGIGLSIGSDSNVRNDPFEELRELEGIARRQELRRNVIGPDELLRSARKAGPPRSGSPNGTGSRSISPTARSRVCPPTRSRRGPGVRMQRGSRHGKGEARAADAEGGRGGSRPKGAAAATRLERPKAAVTEGRARSAPVAATARKRPGSPRHS